MKIAVLGSRGFLGQYIARWFSKDYQVIEVTRDWIDLTDFYQVRTWLKSAQINVIINCATAGVGCAKTEWVTEHLQNNVSVLLNFLHNHHHFDRFINIGSGAEYDRRYNISYACEQEIFDRIPADSYGYSKNIISRMCYTSNKFYTLRVFGCFDASEAPHRLFRRIYSGLVCNIVDRDFDFISASDLCVVIRHYISQDVAHRDINCVYYEKISLWNIAHKFIKQHKLPTILKLDSSDVCNYTGDGKKLQEMTLPLKGLIQSLEDYV
jgi:dTDP-4-dehydrorhamnose reductase